MPGDYATLYPNDIEYISGVKVTSYAK